MSKGHKKIEWHKKKNQRNEGLDIYVYNLAAAYFLGLHKYSQAQWATLRAKVCPATPDLFAKDQPPVTAPSQSISPGGIVTRSDAKPAAKPTPQPSSPFAKDSWSNRL